MTAYEICQCLVFIIIPLSLAECFHISVALRYAVLTVNQLTPALRPRAFLEEAITQKLVASPIEMLHLVVFFEAPTSWT